MLHAARRSSPSPAAWRRRRPPVLLTPGVMLPLLHRLVPASALAIALAGTCATARALPQRSAASPGPYWCAVGGRRGSEVRRGPSPVSPRDPARGSAAAPVTIVEFADFECPFCQRAAGTMAELFKVLRPAKIAVGPGRTTAPLPRGTPAKPARRGARRWRAWSEADRRASGATTTPSSARARLGRGDLGRGPSSPGPRRTTSPGSCARGARPAGSRKKRTKLGQSHRGHGDASVLRQRGARPPRPSRSIEVPAGDRRPAPGRPRRRRRGDAARADLRPARRQELRPARRGGRRGSAGSHAVHRVQVRRPRRRGARQGRR